MASPEQMMTARSMTLRSSRTLPGHVCDCSASTASVLRKRAGRACLSAELRDEVLREQRYVVLALAQRGEVNCDDVEAVEQVFAERAASTASAGSRFVAASTRTSTGISFVAAQPTHLSVFEHAQKLRL